MSNPAKRIPVHLITGFLGVGKTTAINHLMAQKPEGERWALVVNEFGQIGVDASLLDAGDGIQVKEIPGGCICCALGLTLSVTLVNLLQRFKPDRLFIEPTGLGHPAGILDLLQGEQFNEVLELHPVITLVDARQLDDPRVMAHETFQDQISLADILVFNKSDLATPEQTALAVQQAGQLFPPKLAVLTCQQGQLPLSVLDSAVQLIAASREQKQVIGHETTGSLIRQGGVTLPFLAMPQPGQPVCQQGDGLGAYSVGWVFHRDDAFDEDCLYQWVDQQKDLLRLKGVFRVGSKTWRSFSKVGSELVVQPVAYRRDSRLELISEQPLDAAALQQQLLAMTYKPAPATLFD
ncbi:CobW family GTP-binding protein [Marinospirillum alkaliphilum]|uniref:GTPase, G3E family n=1 Tax=Marinospirillum alkaliphilum DSM 21637 TaxID=1122209 RepID=A0A1K1YV84_9GAMM|nr:GTP-binding protein [Marinospirillum alkaliphilum]SFX65268.1 GTPase, G3E family [Marinospirillum alkaliphilum DSM 21637]